MGRFKFTEEDIKKIKNEYNSKLLKDLSSEIGCSESHLRKKAYSMGISKREKRHKENLNEYLDIYKRLCIESNCLIPVGKLTQHGLPNFKWFVSNFDEINSCNDFIRMSGLLPKTDLTKKRG